MKPMRIATPSREELERRARTRARRRRRDARVAHGALKRARGSARAAAAALREEARGYRAEAGVLPGGDGGLGAWRAAERRDRAAAVLERLCEGARNALQSL